MRGMTHQHLTAEELEKRADWNLHEQYSFLQDLVQLRSRRGLSREDVAADKGVSVQAVEDFEQSDANPTMLMIRLYALAVGADFAWRVHN